MQGHAIDWEQLQSIETWTQVQQRSHANPILLFKHSKRCGISHMALERLETQWMNRPLPLTPIMLDLIQYRSVSNQIAQDMGVLHQSPQIILIWKNEAVFTTSHNAISVPVIASALDQLPVSS